MFGKIFRNLERMIAKITINGNSINVNGINNGIVSGGDIFVYSSKGKSKVTYNSEVIYTSDDTQLDIKLEGIVANVTVNGGNLKCEEVKGDVDVTGNMTCSGNIGGDVDITGNILKCANIGGNIDITGNIDCEIIGGNVDCLGSVSTRK